MIFNYKTKNTCASSIKFTLNDDKTISDVSFTGGCNGNLKAISKLVDGMQAEKVVEILKGNTCGFRSTSCADQLALAIEKALSEQNGENI
jgi:uncharacterized protein (TIGR03905 family)